MTTVWLPLRRTAPGYLYRRGFLDNTDTRYEHSGDSDVFQAVNDSGFTLPAQGGTEWTGEATPCISCVSEERPVPVPPVTIGTICGKDLHA